MQGPYRVIRDCQTLNLYTFLVVSEGEVPVCRAMRRETADRIVAALNFADGLTTEALVEQYEARTGERTP